VISRIALLAGAVVWIALGATLFALFGWSGWVVFAACLVLAVLFAFVGLSSEAGDDQSEERRTFSKDWARWKARRR